MGGRGFSYQAPLMWNHPPVCVWVAGTLLTFKIRMSTFFVVDKVYHYVWLGWPWTIALVMLLNAKAAVGCLMMSHFYPFVFFILHVCICHYYSRLLSLPYFPSQVFLVWCGRNHVCLCYGSCWPLFPFLSTPTWLRQMAAVPECGFPAGFFLLKGSSSSPLLPATPCMLRMDSRRRFHPILALPFNKDSSTV